MVGVRMHCVHLHEYVHALTYEAIEDECDKEDDRLGCVEEQEGRPWFGANMHLLHMDSHRYTYAHAHARVHACMYPQ